MHYQVAQLALSANARNKNKHLWFLSPIEVGEAIEKEEREQEKLQKQVDQVTENVPA